MLRLLALYESAVLQLFTPVSQIHSEEEVARILPIAAKHGVPVTFRAAGTSLSGQAVTDSVLLKLSHTGNNFRKFHIPVSPRQSEFGLPGGAVCLGRAGSFPKTPCSAR
jgi:hypothetical protein